jgi:hypothetical protein
VQHALAAYLRSLLAHQSRTVGCWGKTVPHHVCGKGPVALPVAGCTESVPAHYNRYSCCISNLLLSRAWQPR